jgi:Dyp-type peroxidase family
MEARAELLGDPRHDGSETWDAGLRPGEPHVLVTLSARVAEVLARRRCSLQKAVACSRGGLEITHEVLTTLLESDGNEQFGREHFGFADGLAQPSIAGDGVGPYERPGKGVPAQDGDWRPIEPGEFVLGYRDEDGITPRAPEEPFDRDCSFMVVRKLHQDVAAFTTWLRSQARPGRDAELVAAKILGRWRDGTPLVISPKAPKLASLDKRERAQTINDFGYWGDPDGLRCPLGAHVRRANPRDTFGADHLRTLRHRIIRRGMPYGPPPIDPLLPDGVDRGLMFACYQASIERQFEVVQRWLNDGDAFGLGDEKDFLLSGEDRGRMTIQGDRTIYLSRGSRLVTLKGGGYFFTPSIAALREIAAGRA